MHPKGTCSIANIEYFNQKQYHLGLHYLPSSVCFKNFVYLSDNFIINGQAADTLKKNFLTNDNFGDPDKKFC